jgi:putative acetyltransferase
VPKDAAFLGVVFFDAVRKAGLRDYSEAQVEAWAPAMPNPARLEARAKDGRLIWLQPMKSTSRLHTETWS